MVGGLPLSSVPTDLVTQDPEHPSPPAPNSCLRKQAASAPQGAGPWPAGPDGAGGSAARITRLDLAAHRAWAHSGPAARLQPAASHIPSPPPGLNIPGQALPVLSSLSPRPRDPRRGQFRPAAPRPGPPRLMLPHPRPGHGVGATRGVSGPGTCLLPCPKAARVW